jgi:hypothetical protein
MGISDGIKLEKYKVSLIDFGVISFVICTNISSVKRIVIGIIVKP